ncbi:hypothetical protein DSL72_008482 [Monilinia vaccinii-corymbosi]|uniref:Uncharacterized protein n=1 Tax=Monilinia vaccinii-corymbosi TaxID=61207 RepID=A0A8A3PJU1_9HELO|nr:hypothetical protein DSL72_008482 [Monilinia vaccinii-corymbosi]
MSFFEFLQAVGSALMVAVCVILLSCPIHFDEAPVVIQVASPSPITRSLPEPQAAQPVASSPTTKEMSTIEELMGSIQISSPSPTRKRKVFTPHPVKKRSTIAQRPSFQSSKDVVRSSVAGAQQTKTITSIKTTIDIETVHAKISETISVEVEMIDAPIPELKSCFKSNGAPRSAKSVRFEGPSSDCIRGRVSTFEVDKLGRSYHQAYMASKQAPSVASRLVEEVDTEGNANGWFSKRDSLYFPPTSRGTFVGNHEWHTCLACRGNLSKGFLDPMVDFPDSVLESGNDKWALVRLVKLDQVRRYHCTSHGGS